jgi:hypothetical protein
MTTTERRNYLLKEADIEYLEMGEKTVVCFCKLPSGYEIVTSAHAVNADTHSFERGREAALEKLRAKVAEYVAVGKHEG